MIHRAFIINTLRLLPKLWCFVQSCVCFSVSGLLADHISKGNLGYFLCVYIQHLPRFGYLLTCFHPSAYCRICSWEVTGGSSIQRHNAGQLHHICWCTEGSCFKLSRKPRFLDRWSPQSSRRLLRNTPLAFGREISWIGPVLVKGPCWL